MLIRFLLSSANSVRFHLPQVVNLFDMFDTSNYRRCFSRFLKKTILFSRRHTLEKPHRCDECGYATVELSKLRRHIRTHTGVSSIEFFSSKDSHPIDSRKNRMHVLTVLIAVRIHLSLNDIYVYIPVRIEYLASDKEYFCHSKANVRINARFAIFVLRKAIGKLLRRCISFLTPLSLSFSLKAHMLTHQAEKPSFPCSYCPSVMARKSDLRYHIGKQHARQSEPLSCNKCDEDFPDKYSLRMHGKTHKGQTIHSCTHCEFSANTSQQLEDHMNKHRGTRPFQCSECGLMFAARADLRAHVTRTHRNSLTPTTTTAAAAAMNSPRRPQRRAASLQHRYIGASSGAEEDEQQEDDFRCPICHRQFTSARLLDRHTYAVHEPKQDSYDDRNYQTHEMEDEDDVRDYADDELEEKIKENVNIHSNQLKLEEGITDDEQGLDEEEDLAPNVEDIIEGDDEHEQIPTIKSISSAGKKRIGIVRKFDELEGDDQEDEEVSNKRKCHITRGKTYDDPILASIRFSAF